MTEDDGNDEFMKRVEASESFKRITKAGPRLINSCNCRTHQEMCQIALDSMRSLKPLEILFMGMTIAMTADSDSREEQLKRMILVYTNGILASDEVGV